MAGKKSVFFGRRFGESPDLDPNMWVVPYGDMMTNLMMFFLILFAVTTGGKGGMSKEKEEGRFQKKEEQFFVKKLEEFGNVKVTADKINITLPQDILFKRGSAQLNPDFADVIQQISPYLKKNPGIIIVSGHADSSPLRGGKYKDNWFLSAERGWNVANYLIENGIEPSRIQVRGYGDTKPVASNETEKGRAKNRRIEMTILKMKQEEAKRFIYYKTAGDENVTDISKRILGNENFAQQIRELNPAKVDELGKVLKDTEILIPYNP